MFRYSFNSLWTLASVVIFFLVSNALAAPSPSTTAPSAPDCSLRDELVTINQPGNTSTLLDSIQAAYTTWNSSVRLGFNTYYNKIKNISYHGVDDVDVINELITVFYQYNFNSPSKRQILWNVQIIGWGGTIEDFINCGNATNVTPSTQQPSTQTVTLPSTVQSTVPSTLQSTVTVCASPSGPPDCLERPDLISVDPDTNSTILTDSIQAVYVTWNASMRLGFNTYYNKIRKVLYDNATTEEEKNDALIAIFYQYNFNNEAKRQILWDVMIGCWGTIQDFIECSNGPATGGTPGTVSVGTGGTGGPVTLPSDATVVPTGASVSPTSSGPDCSAICDLMSVDSDSNSTVLTDSIQAAYETWNASMRLGFNTYYNKIRKVLYDNTTSEQEKVDALIAIFYQYNFNNAARRQTLWDVMIEGWGTIEDFIRCGNETCSCCGDGSSVTGGSPGTVSVGTGGTGGPVTLPSGATFEPSGATFEVTGVTVDSSGATYEFTGVTFNPSDATPESSSPVSEVTGESSPGSSSPVSDVTEPSTPGSSSPASEVTGESTPGSSSPASEVTEESSPGSSSPVSDVTEPSTPGSSSPASEVTGESTPGSSSPVSDVTEPSTPGFSSPASEVTGESTPGSSSPVSDVTEPSTPGSSSPASEVTEESSPGSSSPASEVTEESSPGSSSPVSDVTEPSTPGSSSPASEVTGESTPGSSSPVSDVTEPSTPGFSSPASEVTEQSSPGSSSTVSDVTEPSTPGFSSPASEVTEQSSPGSSSPSSDVTEPSTPAATSPSTETESTTESEPASLSTMSSTVQETTESTLMPTTSQVCPTQPPNTASLIVDNQDAQVTQTATPVETCTVCSSGLTEGVKNYYTSVTDANPSNDIDSANAQCNDINKFCMCTESGECFTQKGNSLSVVNFFSYCDSACHMYALVLDGLDGTSGLTGDQGTNFTSTDQLDGDSNTVPMSSGSVYLKAVSVSCNGCPAIKGATCA
ncbi:aggrecan core protein [Ditylenchus destructor]|uniref:Aggrecan core protein n=1 Tax=Ditylenchus destructor TaxID=166010 RepID=A0AAD4MF07_9BILA|nr:aggrecan core protein [Ditylenchus destructor]